MFDNVSFKIENFSQKKFYEFTANYVGEIPKETLEFLEIFWHNLRLRFYIKSERLCVSNSLHKFYNAEFHGIFNDNWDDFTLGNIKKTIKLFSEAFETDAKQMKLYGKFEFGFNLNVKPYRPYQDIILRLESIVNTTRNPFDVFPNPYGKPFGKTCSFCDYKIKTYDKGKESGNPRKNILRYEICNQNIMNTRKVLKIYSPTMADLLKEESWKNCYEYALTRFDQIRILPFPMEDIELYTKIFCYSNPIIGNDYKTILRKRQSELKKTHDDYKSCRGSPHNLVRQKIVENFDLLLN